MKKNARIKSPSNGATSTVGGSLQWSFVIAEADRRRIANALAFSDKPSNAVGGRIDQGAKDGGSSRGAFELDVVLPHRSVARPQAL